MKKETVEESLSRKIPDSTNFTELKRKANGCGTFDSEVMKHPNPGSKKLKIQCTFELNPVLCDDDIIFVKEVKAKGVDLEVKIGTTQSTPINKNGDNGGILKSNMIVID